MRDLILHNFWLKLFSLFLATLIWFSIRMAIQKEITGERVPHSRHVSTNIFSSVPVTVLTDPADSRSYRCVPAEVRLTVSGVPAVMDFLRSRHFDVFVNLTDVRDAVSFQRKIEVRPPQGVSLIRIEPPYVTVQQVSPANKP